MSRDVQIANAAAGGGRTYRVHRPVLTFVPGQVGITGSGAITGGAGGTNGVFPLVTIGGVLAANMGGVVGSFTVAGGVVTAINVTRRAPTPRPPRRSALRPLSVWREPQRLRPRPRSQP